MNKKRRTELGRAKDLLDQALSIIDTAKDEERESFDNLTEGLQQTERGQKAEAAADALDEAHSGLEEVISNIEGAMED